MSNGYSESDEENKDEFASDYSDESSGNDFNESGEDDLEIDNNFCDFEDGLTLSNRLRVKQARKLYFDEKQKQYNAVVAKEVSQRVKEKWTDILHSVGEQSMFDFNILKSLVSEGNQSTIEPTTLTQEQLDIKQQGDDWDYTIGLKEEIEKSLKTIDDQGEKRDTDVESSDDNEDDEEITDDED